MNTNGVPDQGIGLLCWPGNAGWQQGFDNWVKAAGFFPTSVLVYPGNFSSITTILYYLQNNNVNVWVTDPRLTGAAFTDLNGKSWPARSPMVPCIGFPNYTTSGDMTFATTIAGTNDAQIAQVASMWFATGIFKQIEVRIGYEDNFSTTPAGFPGTASAAAYNNDFAAWLPAYVGGWRRVAHVLHSTAAQYPGCSVKCIWGPCFINWNANSPSLMDPDQTTVDGFGYQVDLGGPDCYIGNYYSADSVMQTGYQNDAPFLAYPPTVPTPTSGTPPTPILADWAADEGSVFWYGDFEAGVPGKYVGPLPALPGPGVYSQGWSLIDAINWSKNRPNGAPVVPLMFPEHGVLDANGGAGYETSAGPSYPPFATWLRTRIQAMQNIGVPFHSANLWAPLAPAMLTVYGQVFPELSGGSSPVAPQNPMTAISVVVNPPSNPPAATAGQAYTYVATANGPWSAPSAIQFEQIIPSNGNSSTGWVTPAAANVSVVGNVATISNLTSGFQAPHTVQVRDTGTGITSPAVTYGVVPTATIETVTVSFSDNSTPIVTNRAAGVTTTVSIATP